LYDWMTVRESGRFQAGFYASWNEKVFRNVTGHFGLKDDARVRELSRGQRAGLSLALTLAPDPELLIFDDPAMGLDPVARRSLVESMIFLTRRSERTIFFSTHHLADVERVADWVAVMDDSVLRASCTLETFRGRVRQVRLFFGGTPPAVPALPGLLKAVRLERELRLYCVPANGVQEGALRQLGAERIETVPVSLEDALLSYLGERGEQPFILSDTEAKHENAAL
ncbi:MAG TPA: AAA family ATPase, partial [Clostridia bacterium]|nr:AAA family ATPase [Clostridia bacterium]